MKRGVLAGCLLIAAAGFGGCLRDKSLSQTTWPVMGTFASVSVAVGEREALAAYAAICRTVLSDLEAELSVYSPTSDVSRINRKAGGDFVAVAEPTQDVLRESVRYSRLSGGAFDPTVAPLVQLWGFSGGRKPDRLPGRDEIESRRAVVGYDALEWGATGVRLARPGAALDLGGIAKGYAVDRCYEALLAAGARNFMVNLGGNMRCNGRPEPDRAWRIGVRNPFDRGTLIGSLDIASGMAVATSGNYERYVMIEGKRYAHVIDPRTGFPVTGMAGVTVLASNATAADALSTACYVAGIDGAAGILKRADGAEALLVPDRQPLEIHVSPGFRERFCPDPRAVEPAQVKAVSSDRTPKE